MITVKKDLQFSDEEYTAYAIYEDGEYVANGEHYIGEGSYGEYWCAWEGYEVENCFTFPDFVKALNDKRKARELSYIKA